MSTASAAKTGIDGAASDAINEKIEDTSDYLNQMLEDMPEDMTIKEQAEQAFMIQQLGIQTEYTLKTMDATNELLMKCVKSIKIPTG